VGATAGVNYKAFGPKTATSGSGIAKAKGAGISGRARKTPKPHGIGPKNASYGIVDGHGSSGGDMSQRANSMFKIAKGKGKITKDGGSNI
jgi:hypothetical protein